MKRNKFSLSNYKLATFDMGELTPVGLTEVLPGDSIQQSTSALVRVSPLLAPVMHDVTVSIHHWFVPHRLTWDNWENFITGGPDGLNASVFPTINFPTGGPEIGTLADYLGVPTDITQTGGTDVSALPFRAYAQIWNEHYRDQDLQTKLVVSTADGADTTTNTALQNVCWEKDIFTSARPWTQKGPEVTIPLGTTAPVSLKSTLGVNQLVRKVSDHALSVGSPSTLTYNASSIPLGVGSNPILFDPNGTLESDLSSATAATINSLREAFAIQRYEEARARYGSRYVEYLRYLGVKSSDARLQRPEYLGGGRQKLQFSEVLQTGPETAEADTPVGDMAGHGIAAMRSNRYRRFFEEHGYVITVMSVKPKTMYAQGLPKTWNRRTKEDFFQKELQHIGQQEIANKEVYAGHTSPNGTFGYNNRYEEYRKAESTISGEFRSTLDFWHMARIFSSQPALNADFVKANPTKRINAVQSEDVLWVMAKHSIQARRIVDSSTGSHIY